MSDTVTALEAIADSFREILERAEKGEAELTPALREEMARFVMQVGITKLKLKAAGL